MNKIKLALAIASTLTLHSVAAHAAQFAIDVQGRYETPDDVANHLQHDFTLRLGYDTADFPMWPTINDPLLNDFSLYIFGAVRYPDLLGPVALTMGTDHSDLHITQVTVGNHRDALYHLDSPPTYDYSATVEFALEGFYFRIEADDSPTQFFWNAIVPTADQPFPFAGNGSAPTFSLTQNDSDTVFYVDSYSVRAVPVPAAAWLFGSALAGLAGVRRKRAA